MTARLQYVLTDDLDEQDKVLTDIGTDGETHVVSLDGVVRELHLTKEHADQLREDLAPYLKAGHQPGAQPEMPPPPGSEDARREKLRGQGRRRELPGTRDFYRELREWAEERGTPVKQHGRVNGKQNYIYGELLPDYLEYLTVTAAAGRDGGVAAARLDMARQLGLLPLHPPPPPNGQAPAGTGLPVVSLARVSIML